MEQTENRLLKAIHEVDSKIVGLQTTIDIGVNQRFNELERRVTGIEKTIMWVVVAVVGAVLIAILKNVGL